MRPGMGYHPIRPAATGRQTVRDVGRELIGTGLVPASTAAVQTVIPRADGGTYTRKGEAIGSPFFLLGTNPEYGRRTGDTITGEQVRRSMGYGRCAS